MQLWHDYIYNIYLNYIGKNRNKLFTKILIRFYYKDTSAEINEYNFFVKYLESENIIPNTPLGQFRFIFERKNKFVMGKVQAVKFCN